jgi:uncharacterized RDD family membrane protein YckC
VGDAAAAALREAGRGRDEDHDDDVTEAPTQIVGRRVAAFILDLAIWWAIAFGLFFLLATKGRAEIKGEAYYDFTSGGETWYVHNGQAWLWMGLTLCVLIGLAVVLQSVVGGSPGKLMLGIRVVDANGERAGFGANLVRLVGWIVDGLPWFFLFGLAGFVTALNAKGNRRVGDMMARTYVVKQAFVGQAVVAGGAPVARAVAPQGRDAFGNPIVPSGTVAPGPVVPSSASIPPPPGAPPPPPSSPTPDWYPDPTGQARLRYWDGRGWTSHTAP